MQLCLIFMNMLRSWKRSKAVEKSQYLQSDREAEVEYRVGGGGGDGGRGENGECGRRRMALKFIYAKYPEALHLSTIVYWLFHWVSQVFLSLGRCVAVGIWEVHIYIYIYVCIPTSIYGWSLAGSYGGGGESCFPISRMYLSVGISVHWKKEGKVSMRSAADGSGFHRIFFFF